MEEGRRLNQTIIRFLQRESVLKKRQDCNKATYPMTNLNHKFNLRKINITNDKSTTNKMIERSLTNKTAALTR